MLKHVEKIVSKHNTTDPFELANKMNITIRLVPLKKMLGFNINYNKVNIIHINENLSDSCMLFVCAIQLGHTLLHPEKHFKLVNENTIKEDPKNHDLKIFAEQLLENTPTSPNNLKTKIPN